MRLIITAILALFLLGATDTDTVTVTTTDPVVAAGMEQRCADLGGSCICSEPLNNNDTGIATGWNPSDSTGSKECTDLGTFMDTNKPSTALFTTAEARMPAANTVSNVLEVAPDGGDIVWGFTNFAADANTKRACLRFYIEFDNDFSGAANNQTPTNCPTERVKIMQFDWSGGQPNQFVSSFGGVDGDCHGNCLNPPCPSAAGLDDYTLDYKNFETQWSGASNGNNQFSFNPRECNEDNGWCSLELCAWGDLDGPGTVFQQARIKTLKDGVTSSNAVVSHTSAGALTRMAGDWFHGQGQGGIGSYRFSHYMSAKWDSCTNDPCDDADKWIGPAVEIEGTP